MVVCRHVSWHGFSATQKPRRIVADAAATLSRPNECDSANVTGWPILKGTVPAMGRTRQYIANRSCRPSESPCRRSDQLPRIDENMTRPVEVVPDGYVSDARPTAKNRPTWTSPARYLRAVVYDAPRSLPPRGRSAAPSIRASACLHTPRCDTMGAATSRDWTRT